MTLPPQFTQKSMSSPLFCVRVARSPVTEQRAKARLCSTTAPEYKRGKPPLTAGVRPHGSRRNIIQFPTLNLRWWAVTLNRGMRSAPTIQEPGCPWVALSVAAHKDSRDHAQISQTITLALNLRLRVTHRIASLDSIPFLLRRAGSHRSILSMARVNAHRRNSLRLLGMYRIPKKPSTPSLCPLEEQAHLWSWFPTLQWRDVFDRMMGRKRSGTESLKD
jgi:hypothetical protein